MMLPDLRKIEPELLEDDIECALQDSMDVDWTCSTGAHAVMRMLFAIATEAQRAGTVKQGPVYEGAGRRHRQTFDRPKGASHDR